MMRPISASLVTEFQIQEEVDTSREPLSPEQPRPLLIGLSGPSSSGKTTLARLLKRILPNATIIHQDDFYFQDSRIPYRSVHKRDEANGGLIKLPSGEFETHKVQDWDCVEALDIPALHEALSHIRECGDLPPLKSKEDQNSIGPGGEIDSALADELQKRVLEMAPSLTERLVILVDGFMLFANGTKELLSLFDIKLLLRTTFLEAKTRRDARTGYVTLEGFWEDPPFYVDDIVWPNYVKEHAYLFEHGDVESEFDQAVCAELDIDGMPKNCGRDVVQLVQWAVRKIIENVENIRERSR